MMRITGGPGRVFLDELWRDLAGVKAVVGAGRLPGLDQLRKSEWCGEFEKLMRNRLIMGAFRYGPIAKQDYRKYDLVKEMHKRIDRYRGDRNLEHLVDTANMAMLAFIHGKRIGEVLQSVDDGEHTPEREGVSE